VRRGEIVLLAGVVVALRVLPVGDEAAEEWAELGESVALLEEHGE